ncbi:T9SS type A sorting domain-containing protein [Rudanella paleaurantiibacter]|uniref:T9SS type A sorting domain-containing protein n=1 Tax=Rudanella paleaurantiibacter TaxID=2614655 RepID=A0A7J5TUX2_9BACT|nr:T9SS type A sorting domain-containing protein [Rudanella paleaurantiibacter]KAB7727944.1 T9SS type A sorting domain-containing protein [Rudanella paleaurantiibacter]
MKQHILFWACLTGLVLSAGAPLRAQSDARTRSRLETGRTGTSPKLTPRTEGSAFARKFPFLAQPNPTGLDRVVPSSKTSVINSYYRSLLIAPASTSVTKPATRPAQAESTAAASTEAKAPTEESLRVERTSDERLFANDRISVSNVYPNPASDYADIDYQITAPVGEAKITVLDLLGSPISEYTLDAGDRKVRIATREMPTGMYFYRLSLDGKKVATKKLLVQHR